MVGLDVACRVLQSGEVDAAIVATSNFYLNPDQYVFKHICGWAPLPRLEFSPYRYQADIIVPISVIDAGNVGQAHSPSGLCHTFDIDADGYVKAEAVSCVIVKRLSDAVRDRDPIRAVIRGGGIASPSAEAQAAAIRSAYANAGIENLNDTQYLECHGTGTQAGDPTEVRGAGYAFASTREEGNPLIIGSVSF